MNKDSAKASRLPNQIRKRITPMNERMVNLKKSRQQDDTYSPFDSFKIEKVVSANTDQS